MTTLADLADRAGVGVSTAARALSGKGYIAPATRRRVLAAAEELGYVPNTIARSLRTRRTRMIGLLVADVENTFYSVIARHVESTAKASGYHVVLCNDNDDPAEEHAYLTILEGLGIDGLILTPTAKCGRQLQRLRQNGLAIVQIDRQLSTVRTDTVLTDNEGGTRDAVDHLVERGHTNIGILTGPLDIATAKRRLDGFAAAMAAHGLTVPPSHIKVGSFQRDDAVQEALALMEARPTAIFAANNILAEAVVFAVDELGLRIPDDVSLIAFDDMPWMALASPKITAVRQPIADMAQTATDMLLRRLRDNSGRPSNVVFQPELVVRESVTLRSHPKPTHGKRRTRAARK